MKLQKYKNKNKTYILHRTHSLQTARRSLPRKLTHHFWICIQILAIRSMVNSTTIHSFPVKVDFEVRISSHFGGSACRVKQFPLPPTEDPKKRRLFPSQEWQLLLLSWLWCFFGWLQVLLDTAITKWPFHLSALHLDVLFIGEDNLVTLQQLTWLLLCVLFFSLRSDDKRKVLWLFFPPPSFPFA